MGRSGQREDKMDQRCSCHGNRTLNAVGGEEGDVTGFQRVVMGAVGRPGLGLRFAGQGGIVNLEYNKFVKKKIIIVFCITTNKLDQSSIW